MEMGETQKELFNEYGEKKRKRRFFQSSQRPEVVFTLSSDTLLLLFVLLAMGAVILYTVGVEMGKKKDLAFLEEITVPKEMARSLPEPEVSLPEALPPPPVQVAPPVVEGKFTVQVASLRDRAAVDRALEHLKSRIQQEAFFIKGSEHYAICVGSYGTRQEADYALRELQRWYDDAFVRNR